MSLIKNKKIIAWWSGGITSAVTCKLCIDIYGLDACTFIFMDTHNEDEDTYRFKSDCEKWYGKEIKTISGIDNRPKHEDLKAKPTTDSYFFLDTSKGYANIQEVWRKHKSLNVATGAICSSELKRQVRLDWQKENNYDHQAFGFEFTLREMKRAFSLKLNYPDTKAIFPLLGLALTKKECGEILREHGIDLPRMYEFGFHNNNCFKTGCVQGGIGYWQKMRDEFPEKFVAMAAMEHELTDAKGTPVTMLKDQSKEAEKTGNKLVFLKPHPDYPQLKSLADMKPQKVEPLFECNGFCSTNDLLPQNPVQAQLNFEME